MSAIANPTSLAAAPAPPSPIARPANRIGALDWVKGALVVCMVIYHSINYSSYKPFGFRFLPFLPSSFILIAGFIVGQVYARNYDLTTAKPYVRLAIRGVKLLALFSLLNLFRCMAVAGGLIEGFWELGDRAVAIFVSGNGRTGIFEVLLPIAYFLMLAPPLLLLRSRAPVLIPVAAGLLCLVCMSLQLKGASYKNLDLLSAGLLGMALGMVRLESLNRLAARWGLVIAGYLGYRLASLRLGEIYPVQMSGALISLLLLYSCALYLERKGLLNRSVILLGQYSLLGYLGQIVILQGLVVAMGGRPQSWPGVLVFGGITGVALFVLIGITDRVRKVAIFNSLYRAIFA